MNVDCEVLCDFLSLYFCSAICTCLFICGYLNAFRLYVEFLSHYASLSVYIYFKLRLHGGIYFHHTSCTSQGQQLTIFA
jgi:hypothetical protein